MKFIPGILAATVASMAAVTGVVVDQAGNPIPKAFVSVKTAPNLLPDTRTLSSEDGKFSFAKTGAKKATDKQILVVRKTGFLPETLSVEKNKDFGNITLKRDPIEDQIDSILKGMPLEAQIAQMTQPLVEKEAGKYPYGSALHGGGRYSDSFYTTAWKNPIPTSYGKDNVHGMGDVPNATIFPHNIGLGATRDTALVRKIGQVVAEEMWAAHIDLNFAPAVSVPKNEHWGRTYEGFGEKGDLVADMGAAYVRGLQGDHFDAEWRVTATLKHFIGDGATDNGVDRGNATLKEKFIQEELLPPYLAAIEQGAMSVMASFNQVNRIHQHVDPRMTTMLKEELGFDGYIIADWEGIDNSRTSGKVDAHGYGDAKTVSSEEAIKNAINAGIDLAMVPNSYESFMSTMKELVEKGDISKARVEDAVRRILRTKIRAGRIANPAGPTKYEGSIGSQEHRAIAREAVRKSLVLLKNTKSALPLSKSSGILLTGTHADNGGLQCGGWSQGWQGTRDSIPGVTTIKQAFLKAAPAAMADSAAAKTVVYVIGEGPYAEWHGDHFGSDMETFFKGFTTPMSDHIDAIKAWKKEGKKVVVVLITGRPLPITKLIDASDAFVVAWHPGSEGDGVADVLFGDYKPTGKLPHTWPKNEKQIPINDGDGKKGLFPYGFGLSYAH